jgi:hypothetical protein
MPCRYELDDEDLSFLADLQPADRRICTDAKLEDVFDMLEKESYRSGSIAPITVAERANIKPSLLATIYDFWTKKRARWGKPLIRRFQPPTQARERSRLRSIVALFGLIMQSAPVNFSSYRRWTLRPTQRFARERKKQNTLDVLARMIVRRSTSWK